MGNEKNVFKKSNFKFILEKKKNQRDINVQNYF